MSATEPATALRFPRDAGAFIVVPVQTHGSKTYTRDFRVSVDHVVLYYPHSTAADESVMILAGRSEQPLRVLLAVEELDALIRQPKQPSPADVA